MAMDKVLLSFKVLKGKKLKEKLLIFDIVEIILNLDEKQLVIEKPIKANTYSSKNNYPSGPSQCLKIGEGTQYGDNMPPLR